MQSLDCQRGKHSNENAFLATHGDEKITPAQCRFLRFSDAVAYSGLPRTSLYRAIAQSKIVAKKSGRATLIERESLDRHLDDLPVAKLGKQQPA